jgi:hypothetical protein
MSSKSTIAENPNEKRRKLYDTFPVIHTEIRNPTNMRENKNS